MNLLTDRRRRTGLAWGLAAIAALTAAAWWLNLPAAALRNLVYLDLLKGRAACLAGSCPPGLADSGWVAAARQADPQDCSLARWQAHAWSLGGSDAQALAALENRPAACQDDLLSVYLSGLLAYRLGQDEVARQALRPLGPAAARPFYRLGQAYELESRFAEAERAYLTAAALDPAYLDAYYELSGIYWGRPELSIPVLEKALALETPGSPAAAYTQAKIYIQQEDWRRAAPALEAVTRLLPQDAWAWFFLAQAKQRLGDSAGAQAGFEQVLQLDSRHGNAALELGRVAAAGGRLEQALAYYNQARQADSRLAAQSYTLEGQALEAAGQAEPAAEAYRQALRLDPAQAEAAAGLQRLAAGGSAP
jgi:tetratricopeptide (TPR) repeat protein